MNKVDWNELAEIALTRIRASGAEYGDIRKAGHEGGDFLFVRP